MRLHDLVASWPGPVTFWTSSIYVSILTLLIYKHETIPPAPQHVLRGLNLTEAWQDLRNITNAYHPFNSRDNDRIRQFIQHRSKEILDRNGVSYNIESLPATISQNLQVCSTENQDCATVARVTMFDDQAANFTLIYDAGAYLSDNKPGTTWTAQYFEGNNYYIYIRGKHDPEGRWWLSEESLNSFDATGGVLVNCHFDSVATSYGATDDGVACVSMLQLLSYFTSDHCQPDNGIVLLFNNAEEDGLLGSRAFTHSPLVQFCRVFVNLEGVGAGGRAMLFRTTDLGAAVAYSGSPHPFGSIVANEGFDTGAVMSGTDYEVFSEACGLSGLDIAFYKPRSRYHTTEDDARHTSVDSIWHMLSAALATTKKLSQSTDAFPTLARERPEKPDRGVWFDWLGSAWIAFPLEWLFWWSLTLLIATPLIIAVLVYLLVRKDKCHLEQLCIGSFRLLMAFAFAVILSMTALIALAKFNPLILHSNSYTVWLMAFSSCYFGLWIIMTSSVNLTRISINFWLFALSWAFQVFAATVEHRFHTASVYSAAFFHSAVFASLSLSLLELFALPSRRSSIQEARIPDQAGEEGMRDNPRRDEDNDLLASHAFSEEASFSADLPFSGTPESRHDSVDRRCLVSACRRYIARLSSYLATVYESPRLCVQGIPWSSQILGNTWFLQLLILAPAHLVLVGSQGLTVVSAVAMTGPDGSNLLAPFVIVGLLSIVLILPLAPFMGQITYHIPTLLLLAFMGTLVHNFTAFPFSADSRFRFIFQQTVDLDKGTNVVTLSGVDKYLRLIIDSLPEATGQPIECQPTVGRALMDCQYHAASSHRPNLANGADLVDLIKVVTSKSEDGKAAHIQLDAMESRTCYLDFSRPISNFTINGEAQHDQRLSQRPSDGQIQHIQVWRRHWESPWHLDVQLTDDQHLITDGDSGAEGGEDAPYFPSNDLELRSETTGLQRSISRLGQSLAMTVRCAWSDANSPATIPALHHLQQYMPPWAIVTKRGFSLVEVRKQFQVV